MGLRTKIETQDGATPELRQLRTQSRYHNKLLSCEDVAMANLAWLDGMLIA